MRQKDWADSVPQWPVGEQDFLSMITCSGEESPPLGLAPPPGICLRCYTARRFRVVSSTDRSASTFLLDGSKAALSGAK